MAEVQDKAGQISLRGLLLLVVLVCVAAALCGPAVRELNATQRLLLLVPGGLMLVVSLVWMAVLFLRRRRAERECGRLLYRLTRGTTWWLQLAPILLLLLAVSQQWSMIRHADDATEYWARVQSTLLTRGGLTILVTVFATQMAVIAWWWRLDPRGLELRQRGLIVGGLRLSTWSLIREYRWNLFRPGELMLRLANTTEFYRVRKRDREAVEQILREHVSWSHPASLS